MQAQMLGRVSAPHDRAPAAATDLELLAVHYARIAVGQSVDRLAEAAEAGPVVLERRIVPAGGVVEPHAVDRGLAPGISDQHAAGDVLEPRRPEPTFVLPGEPPCHPDMV